MSNTQLSAQVLESAPEAVWAEEHSFEWGEMAATNSL